MGPHVEALAGMLRQECCLSFFRVYRRVELSTMASVLGSGIVPDPQALPTTIMELLEAGKMPHVRLDLENLILSRTNDGEDENKEVKIGMRVSQTNGDVRDDGYATLSTNAGI